MTFLTILLPHVGAVCVFRTHVFRSTRRTDCDMIPEANKTAFVTLVNYLKITCIQEKFQLF